MGANGRRRKGGRAAEKKKRKPRDAGGGGGACGALPEIDWERASVTLTVGDTVLATFASLEEFRAYVKAAGGTAKAAAALAAAAAARRPPDGVTWN
jgi:class 3 adenylate cyclase